MLPLWLTLKVVPETRDVAIFMAHGIHDPLIPLARARHAHDLLTGLGYRIAWHEYPIPHAVSDAEIRDITVWLQRILARPS